MSRSFVASPVTRLARELRNIEPSDTVGACIAILALAPLLLIVAFWNRFPLIFYDTGAYALEGLGGHFLVERSPVYSLFLRFGGAGYSLWLIVALQAFATAFVMVECARILAPRLSVVSFLGLCVVLVIATGLPWYVGEVEPDCFAAVAVLALYLLAFHSNALGSVRGSALLAVGGFATAAHASHLLLVAGLWCSFALFLAIRALARGGGRWPSPTLARPAIMIVMAVGLVLSANFFLTRQVFLSRAGPDFLFARLLQDRIVTRLLDETCPASGYRLCAYKDVLPPTANAWLWAPYSPFFKLGGFEGTRSESSRIVRDSLARYPMLNVEMAVADAARQFFSFGTGDQVEPQQWAIRPAFAHFMPSQVHPYLSARQQLGQIDFRVVNRLHIPVAYLSLVLLAAFIGLALWASELEAALFLATVMLALLGNALVCGALSNPHDRYQSRLIWMAPFAVMLVGTAATWKKLRWNIGSREAAAAWQFSGHWRRLWLAATSRIRH